MTPFFLHAGFRTGSTLLWSALKATPATLTYFEPLHEALENLPPPEDCGVSPEISGSLHESGETGDVFAAFRGCATELGGVRQYRKSFSYDDFFVPPDAPRSQLQGYFQGLIDHAEAMGKAPSFKCVRTGGRVGWLKRQFDGRHIGVVRDPIGQFSSYLWNAKRGNPYFMGLTCLIYARNIACNAPEFSAHLQLPLYHSPKFADEVNFYEETARKLTLRELYFAFYTIWKKSFIHSLNHADLNLSVDAGQKAFDRLADFLGADGRAFRELAVRPSRAAGAVHADRELSIVEDLVDWLLETNPRHERLGPQASEAGVEFCSPLQARLEKTLALQAGELRFSGDLGEVACAVARTPGLETKSLFGSRYRPPPFPHQFHRLLNDSDATIRFSASSFYLGPDVRVDMDGELQIPVVTFDASDEVAAFGPHIDLPAGTYELQFEYDCAGRNATDSNSGLEVAIVADYRAQIIHPGTIFPPSERTFGRIVFSIPKRVSAFEVRFQSQSSTGKLFGYSLAKIE